MDYMRRRMKDIEEMLQKNKGACSEKDLEAFEEELRDLKNWTKAIPKVDEE